jgi:hypothetical protein
MSKRLLQSLVCAVAILATLATDFAPHHHDDFGDLLSASVGGTDIHDADCRAPRSLHFDSDKVRHADTCVACLRQHLQVIGRASLERVPQSVVISLTSFTAIAHVCTVNLCKSSRAPPPARV